MVTQIGYMSINSTTLTKERAEFSISGSGPTDSEFFIELRPVEWRSSYHPSGIIGDPAFKEIVEFWNYNYQREQYGSLTTGYADRVIFDHLPRSDRFGIGDIDITIVGDRGSKYHYTMSDVKDFRWDDKRLYFVNKVYRMGDDVFTITGKIVFMPKELIPVIPPVAIIPPAYAAPVPTAPTAAPTAPPTEARPPTIFEQYPLLLPAILIGAIGIGAYLLLKK
jgi:hypothetical protein